MHGRKGREEREWVRRLVNTLNPRFLFVVKMRGTFFTFWELVWPFIVYRLEKKKFSLWSWFLCFLLLLPSLFLLSSFSSPSCAQFFSLIWDLRNVSTITQWNSITQMKYLIVTFVHFWCVRGRLLTVCTFFNISFLDLLMNIFLWFVYPCVNAQTQLRLKSCANVYMLGVPHIGVKRMFFLRNREMF